jgi:hypothetical protein
VRVILAVPGPVLAALIWGVLIGPKARWRPGGPLRIAIETVLFLVSAALLALAGYAVLAVISAVAAGRWTGSCSARRRRRTTPA